MLVKTNYSPFQRKYVVSLTSVEVGEVRQVAYSILLV